MVVVKVEVVRVAAVMVVAAAAASTAAAVAELAAEVDLVQEMPAAPYLQMLFSDQREQSMENC